MTDYNRFSWDKKLLEYDKDNYHIIIGYVESEYGFQKEYRNKLYYRLWFLNKFKIGETVDALKKEYSKDMKYHISTGIVTVDIINHIISESERLEKLLPFI